MHNDFNGSNVKKGIGVYPQTDFGSETVTQVVMAPIPEHDALALNGVEIGDATKVTLVCTADNQGLTSEFTIPCLQSTK